MVTQLKLGDVAVDVVLKDIKNVHLGVYPPNGKVRISAPSRMRLDIIRVFVISKLDWIRQQQKKFHDQERDPPREYLDRESHYVWGKRYLLKVVEEDAAPKVELKHNKLLLRIPSETMTEKKQAIIDQWYREKIKAAAPHLIAKWQPVLGVNVECVFVQQMKTKWGSCNPTNHSIRLNTELAKKPAECLEYIVVHEMAHLLVRRHNDQFVSLMDKCLPNWKLLRQALNQGPLSHVDWTY